MRSGPRTGLAVLLAVGVALAAPQAKPTRVMVHVVAHDAKLLGTHVGGARITLRDVATGKVLAEGVQQGGTGDTQRIMTEPHRRGATLYDSPDAAGFLATVMLEQPTVVEIVAEGPLGHAQAIERASKTLLLVPGEDVLGDGVVLEIHGFILEFLQPAPDAPVKAGDPIPVRAKMTMTCGCPTEPGGLWDSTKIRLVAQLVRKGKVEAEAALSYAGEKSTYSGTLPAAAAGKYELRLVAMDPAKANFGMNSRKLKVE